MNSIGLWRRLRLVLLGWAVLILVAAGAILWGSAAVIGLRMDVAAAITGYDGCRCPMCAEHYLWASLKCREESVPVLGPVNRLHVGSMLAGTGFAMFLGSVACRMRARSIERLDAGGVRCAACGYSLRGLPTGTRCPECGHGASARG